MCFFSYSVKRNINSLRPDDSVITFVVKVHLRIGFKWTCRVLNNTVYHQGASPCITVVSGMCVCVTVLPMTSPAVLFLFKELLKLFQRTYPERRTHFYGVLKIIRLKCRLRTVYGRNDQTLKHHTSNFACFILFNANHIWNLMVLQTMLVCLCFCLPF